MLAAAPASICSGPVWAFPLAAAIVAVLFAAALARDFLARRRSYQAIWSAAMLMYAAASAAVALGAANGWTSGEFRVYWALGAVLNVPFLAQGELDLLIHRRAVRWALYVLLAFVTAYTIAVVRTADDRPRRAREELPSGKEVFGDGSAAHRLPQLVAIPAYVVLLAGRSGRRGGCAAVASSAIASGGRCSSPSARP